MSSAANVALPPRQLDAGCVRLAAQSNLEYLDYGDNQTRVTLRMSVLYRETKGGASYDIEFGEPDGRIVTDAGRLERLPSGKVVLGFDGQTEYFTRNAVKLSRRIGDYLPREQENNGSGD